MSSYDDFHIPFDRPVPPEWKRQVYRLRREAERYRESAAQHLGRAIHDHWMMPEPMRQARRACDMTSLAIIASTEALDLELTHGVVG